MRRPFVLVVSVCGVLALGACGSSPESEQLAPAAAAEGQQAPASLASDLSPLASEAVALADAVLASTDDPAVAEVARVAREESAALLEDLDTQLREAGSAPGEVVALGAGELQAVRESTGDEAVRLGLDGLLRNALQTVNRAKAELAEAGGDRELAERVLREQDGRLQALGSLPAA